MSDPVQSSTWCPPVDVQGALRDVTDASPDARATGPVPPGPDPVAVATTLAHVGGDVIAAGATAEAGITLVPIAIDAFQRGRQLSEEIAQELRHLDLTGDQHRMQGALAVLEGRSDSPEVRARMQTDDEYRKGYERAAQLRNENSDRFRSLSTAVRACAHSGMLAVVDGTDHGATFGQRYAEDPAFAHGVDYMRRLRAANPTKFREQAAALSGQLDQVRANQCSFLHL